MAYSPAARTAYKKRYKFGKTRHAFLRSYIGEWVVFFFNKNENPEDELEEGVQYDPGEPGPTIILQIQKRTQRRPMRYNLTSLSVRELEDLRELIGIAVEMALPTARLRDQEAQDAITNGDDSNPRSYRTVSPLVVREGPGAQYVEGIRNGYEGLPDRVWSGEQWNIRGEGDDLADEQTLDSESENNGSAVDFPSGIRKMGEDISPRPIGLLSSNLAERRPPPTA